MKDFEFNYENVNTLLLALCLFGIAWVIRKIKQSEKDGI